MSRQDIMDAPFGEMLDMMSCFAISEGFADEVRYRKMDFDEAIRLR